MIRQAETYHQELDGLADATVPPTYITRAREAFEPIMDVLHATEWDATQQLRAGELIAQFKEQIDVLTHVRGGNFDDTFKNDARQRLSRMKQVFVNPRSGSAAEFEKRVPILFTRLDAQEAGDTLNAHEWVQMDFDLWKLRPIERFIVARNNAASNSWRDKLDEKAGLSNDGKRDTLLYYLQLGAWDALNCAALRCDEIDEGLFAEDVCGAIARGEVGIRARQKEIMAGRRADCELCFANEAFNSATARRELTPVWTFSEPDWERGQEDGDERASLIRSGRLFVNRAMRYVIGRPPNKNERGWVASCFVPQVPEIRIHVCVEDWFGSRRDSGGKPLDETFIVVPTDGGLVWARFWLEISRSLVTLAIPIVGLLVGAREKLLSMDVTTALVAVFVLGFSTDSVKSALLRGTAPTTVGAATPYTAAARPLPPDSGPGPIAVTSTAPKVMAAASGR